VNPGGRPGATEEALPGWARLALFLLAPPHLRQVIAGDLLAGVRRRGGGFDARRWLRRQCFSADLLALRFLRHGDPPDAVSSKRGPIMDRVTILSDFRQAVRRIVRSPRFAMTVILPLALGLGVGASLFGLVDRLMLRPPPGVQDPDRVVRMGIVTEGATFGRTIASSLAWIDHTALAEHARSLQAVASYFTFRPSLGRGPEARSVTLTLATPSYFSLLGVRPRLGRFFVESENIRGGSAVPCVASSRFWRGTLGGDEGALGTTLLVGSLACTLVGVAPSGFEGVDLQPTELWLPIRAGADDFMGDDSRLWTTDRSHWIRILGRLQPGVSREAASADATLAYRSVPDRHRDPDLSGSMVADPILAAQGSRGDSRADTATWLAGGALGLLLLICANLANLFVARSLGRRRETAMRIALGGGRLRLFASQMMEACLLALAAGMLALVVVLWVGPVARDTLLPGYAWADGPLDLRVAGVAIGLAFGIGALVAGLTALHAGRTDTAVLLRGAGTGQIAGSRGARRARLLLVGFQAALSTVLLIASAGFVLSFRRAAKTDIGFAIDGLLVADLPLGTVGYDLARRWTFYRAADERFSTMAGVTGASLGYTDPWYSNRNERLSVPGRDSLPSVPRYGTPAFDAVTADYLTTMGLRLRRGRWISETDRAGTAPVMVVNEALARLYWPGAEALGRCIRVGEDSLPCREIIGVVANQRFTGRIEDEAIAEYYLPLEQARAFEFTPRLFLRVEGDPYAMAPEVGRILQSLEPDLPAAHVRVLQTQLDPLLAPWRLGAVAFSALGALAAIIAGLGLFSVLAYFVAERGNEFAIRAALGALPSQIARPVVGQGLAVVGGGVVVGWLIASVLARWLEPLLFDVRLLQPGVLLGVGTGLALCALAAGIEPARRAAGRDPVEALRAQ